MPPPSQLTIATQVVTRLVKEEKSYRKELETQEASVQRLKASLLNGASGDGNAEFMLRQEEQAIKQTEALFEPLQTRIDDAVQKLEDKIAAAEADGAPAEEIAKAREALELGKKAGKETKEEAGAA